MKYLFVIQTIFEMDNPRVYTNYLSIFKEYIDSISIHYPEDEFYILMGEAASFCNVDFHNATTIIVSQKEMLNDGMWDKKEILSAYYKYAHGLDEVENSFLDYHVNLIKKKLRIIPDIIVSRDNMAFLKIMFPDALMLYTEVGFISRKPFDKTMYFDITGMNCGSYLHKEWDEIKNDLDVSGYSKRLLDEYVEKVTTGIKRVNPYDGVVKKYRSKYDKLFLLPLQFSHFSNIDSELSFDSQLDVLDYVMDKVPMKIGVIVTQHPDFKVLTSQSLWYLHTKYSNLIYEECFDTYNASSQYLLCEVDGVINLVSTVGLQALFWGIPCLEVGKTFASYSSRKFEVGCSYERLTEEERNNNEKVLYWLLSRYVVTKKFYNDPIWLRQYFVNIKENVEKKQRDVYPKISHDEEVFRALNNEISFEGLPECRDFSKGKNENTGCKIGVFGTGKYLENNRELVLELNPSMYIDNSKDKHGKRINGCEVVYPYEAIAAKVDNIVIMSVHEKEMIEQLIELGYQRERIITFKNAKKFVYFNNNRSDIREMYKEYREITCKERSVLMITPVMTLNGASIALLNMCKILKNNGFKVVVVAPKTGKITAHFLNEEIPVLFDSYLDEFNNELYEFMNAFEYVLFNSLLVQNMIYGIKKVDAKCIWWLHESDYGFDHAYQDLNQFFKPNLRIYGVGNRVISSARSKWGDIDVKNLIYGVEDCQRNKKEYGQKIIISCPGLIYHVKAQDIFLASAEKLLKKYNNVEFWIVGRIIDQNFFETLKPFIDRNPRRIKYLGEYSRNEMNKMYENTDIIVCPSRRDSMPTVVAEAMRSYILTVVSDVTGIASFIKDGINGYVFRSEDVENLTEKLEEAIDYCQDEEKKALSRKIYEEHFSMESFKNEVLNVFGRK